MLSQITHTGRYFFDHHVWYYYKGSKWALIGGENSANLPIKSKNTGYFWPKKCGRFYDSVSHYTESSLPRINSRKGPVIWLARVWSRELRWSNKSPLFYNNGTDEDRLWWWKVTALFCIYLKVIMKMDWILIERAWMAGDYEQQDWCEMAVIIID